ncbi:SMC-Scp complex subunit ScpB [Lutibaculum baratangense]|uniref:Segregation and condensation protein B n=1 Tax=Lutibaculum baratangense AMV1 TaxID=631454 RepID=V4TAT5_9HYPH|nr:SMC-Scp complex subunit ScpB [Lutibaculum baratangense]ESR23543.1 Segregation and condensation protein B [Lutibaculum baratangense AMV1]
MPERLHVVESIISNEEREQLRMLEALLFAAVEPLDLATMRNRLPAGANVEQLLRDLQGTYARRGVNLVRVGDRWRFRTASDLAHLLRQDAVEERKLSRAALETLAIIAYHQPVTRAEIEEVRGVSVNKGVIDVLMEAGWVRMRGRRRSPGRPVTYGTTIGFLDHFGLEQLDDLPGLEELNGAGLLEGRLPPDFDVPRPTGEDDPDEDPLDLVDRDDGGDRP